MTANDLPLSQRVLAPAEVRLPEHPQVAVWRAMTPDDLDAVMVAVRAADEVDHPSWVTPREDIADFFDLDDFDAERDSVIGLDEAGRVVAATFVSRSAAASTAVQVYPFGFVIPELRGKGIGEALLGWALRTAAERGAGLVQLTSDASRGNAHRFYEHLGFVASHTGFKLELRSAARGSGSVGPR